MTSGKLELDLTAGKRMFIAFGAIRPLVGGIFGIAVFCLLVGGLLPAVTVSTKAPLGFYAAVGFIAGFNERFAQDSLAAAAVRLSS
jgi:hypothetical protein